MTKAKRKIDARSKSFEIIQSSLGYLNLDSIQSSYLNWNEIKDLSRRTSQVSII